MIRFHTMITLLVGVLLALLLVVISQGVTYASSKHTTVSHRATAFNATCSDESCNNTDPQTTGCNADAQTLDYWPLSINGQVIGELEDRFSQNCNTHWAKLTVSNTSNNGWSLMVKACTPYQSISNNCGDSYSDTVDEIYSNQVYAPLSDCATVYGYVFYDSVGDYIVAFSSLCFGSGQQ